MNLRVLRDLCVVLLGVLLFNGTGVVAPSSAAESNLFTNPNFDSGLEGWSVNADGCGPAVWLREYAPGRVWWDAFTTFNFPAYSGGAAWLNQCGGPTNPWVAQTVTVRPGKTYQVTGHVRTGWIPDVPPFRSFRVCIDDCLGANVLAVAIANPEVETWLPFSAEFTAKYATATVRFVGEFVADSDYLIDSVAIMESTSSPRALVTDTAATCSAVFLAGDYPSLDAVQYATKRNAINQVNPGVFYYWASVTLPAGGGALVSQSASDGWTRWFSQAPGTQLFNTDCTTVKNARVTTDAGATRASGSGITDGTYYLAVKFATTSVVGAAPPSTDPTYTFTSAAGAPDAQLALVRKGSAVAVLGTDEADEPGARQANRAEDPGRVSTGAPSNRPALQAEERTTPAMPNQASTHGQRDTEPQPTRRATLRAHDR